MSSGHQRDASFMFMPGSTVATDPVTMNASDMFAGSPVGNGSRVPVLILGWLSCISGVFGNMLIITTLLSQPALRSLHNLYIGNLALADLIISAYVQPFWLLDLTAGRHPVLNAAHCILNSYITCWAFSASILTLVTISLNRYFNVCYHHIFVRVFTRQRTLILFLLTWALGLGLCLPNNLNNYQTGYDSRFRLCSFRSSPPGGYPTWFTFCMLVLPSIIIGFSNAAIFRHWRKSRTRLKKWKPRSTNSCADPQNVHDVTSQQPSCPSNCDESQAGRLAAQGDQSEAERVPAQGDQSEAERLPAQGDQSEAERLAAQGADITFVVPAKQDLGSSLIKGVQQEGKSLDQGDKSAIINPNTTKQFPARRPSDLLEIPGKGRTIRKWQREILLNGTSTPATEGLLEKASRDLSAELAEAAEPLTLQVLLQETERSFYSKELSSLTPCSPLGGDQNRILFRRHRLSSSDLSLIRSLLTVFVCCVILYLPLAAVSILDLYLTLPAELCIWSIACAFLNHSINWILYGLLNRTFREGYIRQFLYCCGPRRSKTVG